MAFFQFQRPLIPNTNDCCQGVAVGQSALSIRTTGLSNIAIGACTLLSLTTGSSNVAVGHEAMYNSTRSFGSVGVGYRAFGIADCALYGVAIGADAYRKGSVCGNYQSCVTAVGAFAGAAGAGTGDRNTLIGALSGCSLTTGCNNTFVGYASGCGMTTGIDNTIIGWLCPTAMVGCSGDFLISWGSNGSGAPCGYIFGETGISIGNTCSVAGVGLIVTGEIVATLDITAFYSDRRLKENIIIIDCALDKIKKLTGVKYTANNLAKQFGFENTDRQLGLLADEVEKVLPEAVHLAPFDVNSNQESISGENYLTVKYERLIPLLIEGIKDLNKKIELLDNKLTELL